MRRCSIVLALVLITLASGAEQLPVTGLPFTRLYPLDEIGSVSRGAALGFDDLGRIAVIQGGVCVVLNDSTWIDVAEQAPGVEPMLQVVYDQDGRGYYGALASWGTIERTRDGKLRARPLHPPDRPRWVDATNFDQILCTRAGVYFGGWHGVVFWNRASGEHSFFAVPGLARLFVIGDRVYVSSRTAGVQRMEAGGTAFVPVGGAVPAIDQVAQLDEGRVLASTLGRRLGVFDGRSFTPWRSAIDSTIALGRSSLIRLSGDRVAVAVYGTGLFILTTSGELVSSLTSSEYRRIRDLATNEPGILWVATDRGVEKIFYASPVTVVDHRLGVPIDWPQIVRWRDRTIIGSNGRLYELRPGAQGSTPSFQLMPDQPGVGAWAIASRGDRLLVGNGDGVHARQEGGGFQTIVSDLDVARLVMVEDDLCYAIGAGEIAVLRFADGAWRECAEREAGLGYPAVVHGIGRSAWIELGANRAARVSLRDGKLTTRIFEEFPWTEPRWVNVGAVGQTVVLSGPPDGRIFFDESAEVRRDDPALAKLLAQSPYWVTRLREDAEGTIWASHANGVIKFVPEGGGYRLDDTTLDLVRDRFPLVHVLNDGDIWLSTGSSLYHVDRREVAPPSRDVQPILVSIVDQRTGREIVNSGNLARGRPRIAYAENSLSFLFFAGSYAVAKPSYQFRMNNRAGEWTLLGADSLLTLPNLREGSYHLEVRLADARGAVGRPLTLDFEVRPPWYRTMYWYAGYAGVGMLAVAGAVGWFVRRTRRRNQMLEELVEKRTEELKAAMQRLNEETRNAATLEERTRLAGEIHDSLQQGLSGLMLQLDTTLKHGKLPEDVRSRLGVALNMVSFTRHEVQNAVWDLESPLLNSADLGEALNRMAALISPGAPNVEIEVQGTPERLSSSIQHHLLRIAQEAITNAVRHAGASRISVVLAYEGPLVSVTVRDDGRGFDPHEVMANGIGHFGLRGLRSRTDKISGEFQLVSEPGEGTTIKVTVPLVPAPEPFTHARTH